MHNPEFSLLAVDYLVGKRRLKAQKIETKSY